MKIILNDIARQGVKGAELVHSAMSESNREMIKKLSILNHKSEVETYKKAKFYIACKDYVSAL